MNNTENTQRNPLKKDPWKKIHEKTQRAVFPNTKNNPKLSFLNQSVPDRKYCYTVWEGHLQSLELHVSCVSSGVIVSIFKLH